MIDAALVLFVFDWKNDLDASAQVAVHPVCASEPDFFLTAVGKVKYATVLEEASDDAVYANMFADAFNSGAQAANPAHDKVDLYAGLRSAVESSYNRLVHESVHLGYNRRRASSARVFNLSIDAFEQAFYQSVWCD